MRKKIKLNQEAEFLIKNKSNQSIQLASSVQKFKTPFISFKKCRNKRCRPAKLRSFIHFTPLNMFVKRFTHLETPLSK